MFQAMKPLTSAIILGSQNIHISLHQEIISIWRGLTTLMVINKYSYDLVKTEVRHLDESLSLSNDNVNASNADIYSNDKHVFVVWQQSNSTHSSVALRVSDDMGKSFGSEKILSDYSSDSYPKVFADENNVYITWNVDDDNRFKPRVVQEQEDLTDYKPGIYFIKSEDLGKSFSSPVRFDHNDSFDNGKSQVSAFDKYVYITWVQTDTVNKLGNLFTAKSSDGGKNFTIDQIPISS